MTNPYQPSRVAVVLMEPGFGDRSRADTALEGMEELAGDVSVQYAIPDTLPSTLDEAEEQIRTYAASGLYDLIIAIGNELTDAVRTVATQYPNQKFGMIGGSVNADNVASAIYAEEQGAFLAGVLAAFLVSEDPYTGVIGIIAAFPNIEAIDSMISGFIQGVEEANETYDLGVSLLDTQYILSQNDTTTTTSMTYNTFVNQNASLIFAPVRANIVGVRQGALAAEAMLSLRRRLPLVIAAEGNQDYYGTRDPDIPVAPSWIATSVVPRIDIGLYDIVNKTLWDQFPGGTTLRYNLANNGVNITRFAYSSVYISDDIIDVIKYYHDLIVNGTLTVTP